VGFSASQILAKPRTTQYLDVMAAEAYNMIYSGTMFHVVTYGDYPPQVRYLVDSRSKQQGLPKSRLPYFTEEQKKILAGTQQVKVNGKNN
jgi:beta-glucosidase/6-phospho-beta-glucosidase/beta-galactosidase